MNSTIWDIKETIKHEKAAKENIKNSCRKWEEIISEISTGITNISTSSHEWRIRFECQYLYNRMLMKDIQHMRAEIRMLRNGRQPYNKAIKELKTIGDWRREARDLNVEKWSLKSLRNMYERQLDAEAMAYQQAHDALYNLTNDVRNSYVTRIRQLEKEDNDLRLKTPKRKLKPIAQVPPIKTLPLMTKALANYSTLYQRHHGASLEHQKTTFSGLLPNAAETENLGHVEGRRN